MKLLIYLSIRFKASLLFFISLIKLYNFIFTISIGKTQNLIVQTHSQIKFLILKAIKISNLFSSEYTDFPKIFSILLNLYNIVFL